jgi:hypothetical protein
VGIGVPSTWCRWSQEGVTVKSNIVLAGDRPGTHCDEIGDDFFATIQALLALGFGSSLRRVEVKVLLNKDMVERMQAR